MSRKILVIEDGEGSKRDLRHALEQEGFEVELADSGLSALDLAKTHVFPVVITGQDMNGGDGLDVLGDIKKQHDASQVIIISAQNNMGEAVQDAQLQAFDFVEKGGTEMLPSLLDTVNRAFLQYEGNTGPNETQELVKTLRLLDNDSVQTINVNDAIDLCKKRLSASEDDNQTRKQLGFLYYNLGKFEDAEQCFRGVLNVDDSDAESIYYLGNICLQAKRYDKAISHLQQARKIDPDYDEALYSLGVAHGYIGKFGKAKQFFQQALKSPNYEKTLRCIGVAFGELAEYDKVLKDFSETQKVKRQEMLNFLCHVSIALIYRELKEYKKAIKELQEALTIRENDVFAMLVTGMTYRELGNHHEYRKYFKSAFKLNIDLAFRIYEKETKKAHKLKETELLLENRSKMMSYLCHTMRNTMAGGGPFIRQAMRQANTLLGDQFKNDKAYLAFNNIAGVCNIFDTMSGMLDSFKMMVAEPKKFLTYWRDDHGEDMDRHAFCDIVLKQVCTRLIYEEGLLPQLRNLTQIHGKEIRELRKNYLNEILITQDSEAHSGTYSWLTNHFPIIETTILGEEINFSRSGIRFNFLFSCVSEMVYNAIKYTYGEMPISLEWAVSDSCQHIRCINRFDPDGLRQAGTGKGLEFINNLTELADGFSFDHTTESDQFETKLTIASSLFTGDKS